jgi:hypothetical protein
MANRERGEMTLVVGEQRYRLKLTTNAIAEVEDLTGGKTFGQAVEEGLARGSIKSLRILLWAMLREYHGDLATDDPKSLRQVGNLVDRAGGIDGLWQQVQAFLAANAEPEEAAKAEGRPPDALIAEMVGTGDSST